jgi:2-ketocyclohexanecarboxyl-CoA hydrolase
MTTYEDIIYEERPKGVARITISRPESYNAFRGKTVEELIHAFHRAGWDKSIGVIVLTGAGDKAFCTGGDQGAHDGQYDGRGTIGLPIDEFQSVISAICPNRLLPGSTGLRSAVATCLRPFAI